MSTDRGPDRTRRPDDSVGLRTPEQPSALPDWMLNPPPARRTLGTRLAEGVAALPGAGAVRRRWWAWQRRQPLRQRYPNTMKIIALLVSFVASLALVLVLYALYGQVLSGG
ncbi:hypothetical protein [Verrucosispora sp. WMMC514]|uniref:hypothetical protein n=1 Tax=Verrucosispora sp. WMMC514 TaxID=3015156 RepID=UPI00248B781A|nr:hypothetical protein [Verrucosispora sp. WMMC514]WBB89179.1 hypothetical protein O7597_19385 [Verrucosispora sp. WMMC514]